MTKEEILERNAQYLGIYLFNYKHPKATKWFTEEQAKLLDEKLYKRAVEVLYSHDLIDEATFMSAIELLNSSFTPETECAAEERVRELLITD